MMSPSGAAPSATIPAPRARGTAFGHGKVILMGEHAVVFGHPALAAGLSRGVTATAIDGRGRLTIPAWQVAVSAGDGSPVGQAFGAILARLSTPDVDVSVEASLPARAGLGSSAAFAIAVARAVATVRDRDDETAWAAAGEAETVFHGTPSGIDLAAAASGAVGRFQRPLGWRQVVVLQPMSLCIGLSGRPRDTRAQVDAVRRLRERTPAAAAVIETIGSLAAPAEQALAVGDIDELGRLFDVAHGLLAALRVSSPELDALAHAARAAGAIGAKLTGAGGGGAVIALAPGHERDVLDRWKSAGFDGFVATIGGPAGGEA